MEDMEDVVCPRGSEEREKFLMKRNKVIARLITDSCARNPVEELHGGKFPRTTTGDFSDVKVVFPGGEIPWNELCRISEEEMRQLMLEVEDCVEKLLYLFFIGYSKKAVAALSTNTFMALRSAGVKKITDNFSEILEDPENLDKLEEYLFFTHGLSWDRRGKI